ncbi:glycosyltransferase [Methylobacterium sp. ARG-1]|uniref:glycosyltransferase n=1 Tax=Methylobacterium sp. ARG-1 TaxID=1692501 RepID=UPI0009EA9596|nr:glycosyltransferase [Methylobacterium sp. ARG-1]
MKILMASTPAVGHLNPLLAIARLLQSRGDDIVLTTGTSLASRVTDAGVRFAPLAAEADLDFGRIDEILPDREQLPPGPAREGYVFKRVFLDPMPAQAHTLHALIDSEKPDVVVVDQIFCGSTPLFLDNRNRRPPLITVGVSFLPLDRPDGAPLWLGLPPASDATTRHRYAKLAAQVDASFEPVRSYTNNLLLAQGLPPLEGSLMQERVMHCDAYLMPTAPAFEYDFFALPEHVRFIGVLPPAPATTPLPAWWEDLDGSRQVVLVTQGTVANADFSQLIEPTLTALASRDDLLVVVTTGGRPVEDIAINVPRNVRLAKFLPFDHLLPKIDALVTNGGYGTVSMALARGIPLVVSGLSEDKAEVGARVAWSGTGINLASNSPTPESLNSAVTKVLVSGRFRARARAMAARFGELDAAREVFAIIDELSRTRP